MSKQYNTGNFEGSWVAATRCDILRGQLGKSIRAIGASGDIDGDRHVEQQLLKRYFGNFAGFVTGDDPLQDDWVVMAIDLGSGAGQYVAVAHLGNQVTFPEIRRPGAMYMTGLFTFTGYVQRGQRFDHTSGGTLTEADHDQGYHTNAGAPGSVTLALPAAPSAGVSMSFVVVAAQALRLDPGDNDKINAAGVTPADGKYIESSTPGDRITLIADSNGDWTVADQWPRATGGWTREA